MSSAEWVSERAERAIARARFSSVGQRFLGPRLPLPLGDLNEASVQSELLYTGLVSISVLKRVLEAHGTVPPGTLLIIAANVYVFVKPGGVAFGEVCLNPYAVLHLNQLDRLVKSAFVHRDLFHLLANMTGLLADGAYLESRDGTAPFLARTAVLLALSQGILVGISSAERKLTGRDLSSWLSEAASGFARGYGGGGGGGGGGAELLPFYTSGVVGFSGVNYALKVVTCHRRQPGSMSYVLGGAVQVDSIKTRVESAPGFSASN
jgi:membrane associated rhomboid family serine protease